jgi:diguanylate cyclase (GGDEF)-like protein/putative nucleotidyltransferase with HDIG domain
VPVPRRVRRPILLLLVYGIFLVLIGVTAAAQTILVSEHFTTSILSSIVGNDAATVRTFVNGNLTAADLDGTAPPASVVASEQSQLAALATHGEILRVEIRDPRGVVIFSDNPADVGTQAPATAAFSRALNGQPVADFDVNPASSEIAGPSLTNPDLLREYLPVSTGGSVRAVFAVWRDAGPILAALDETRRDVLIVTLSAGLVAAGILFLVFRGAQGRITRQTKELLEATRRDALTGLLNHGAMVEELATSIDRARATDTNVTVALVDIDNFRLLNDTHGHGAGDQALILVARLLSTKLPSEVQVGRYGPDEFLLMSPASAAASLEPALQLVTSGLVDLSLKFSASERLPITVSAGIATYPDHADSATELLSTAAITVTEAKASGGNAVRVANASMEQSANQTTFDVYQGLIIAVDTKDRYTKRHSEDVARYAMFLADRIGLDDETRQTLRLTALLHDVGKIGIPDNILRKPGVLTGDERGIIEQHVALGDSIVRNLPNVDTIRAGIRHHHERWDGKGYLDHLAAEEIPLVARIISVGDVFSAMTTSRPYRKALDVDEALRRLEDASGTQLDACLVKAFVEGIRTAEHPPLPGEEVVAARLWTPARAVA